MGTLLLTLGLTGCTEGLLAAFGVCIDQLGVV